MKYPKLGKAKVFITLDAKDGFYQIGLDEDKRTKKTFWTPFADKNILFENATWFSFIRHLRNACVN